jgi:hypothetical protein
MLQAWRKAKVLTYAGYMLGFPSDTPESIARDIGIIQKELPIDIMEFFMLTPAPGSKDHQTMYINGVAMDSDTNKYDTEHAVTAHPRMTAEQWESIYQKAWHLYYTPEHITTILKRAVASGIRTSRVAAMIFYFYASPAFEGVHPLQAGLLRRKVRAQRRSLLRRENPVFFYPRRLKEIAATYGSALRFYWKLERMRRRIERDPANADYTDLAIRPAADDCSEALELYERSDGARLEVERVKARAAAGSARAAAVVSTG